MNDEKIITNFLEKNYRVTTTQSDFAVADIDTEQTFNAPQFLELFKTVIGDFITVDNEHSTEVFHRWYSSKKRIIAKKLVDYFDKLDGTLGSNILGEIVMTHFASDNEFHHNFVANYFNDYYSKKFMQPIIDSYLKKFDRRKFSGDLTDQFLESLVTESMYQYEYAIKYLNQWYVDEVLEDKVNDFLNQLVVTLGRTNWMVTWIGHGPVTNDTLKQFFKKENAFQYRYAKGMYEEWYYKAVQDKSERLMKSVESNRSQTLNQAIDRNM